MPANGKHGMRKSAAHALPKCNAHVLESLQLHKLRIFVGGYIHLQVQCRNLVQQFDTVLPVFNMRVRCINCQRRLAAAECGSHNLLAAMRMEANNVCVNLCMQRFARYCQPPKSWCNCLTWFAPSCVIFFLEAADEQQLVCACVRGALGMHCPCVLMSVTNCARICE